MADIAYPSPLPLKIFTILSQQPEKFQRTGRISDESSREEKCTSPFRPAMPKSLETHRIAVQARNGLSRFFNTFPLSRQGDTWHAMCPERANILVSIAF